MISAAQLGEVMVAQTNRFQLSPNILAMFANLTRDIEPASVRMTSYAFTIQAFSVKQILAKNPLRKFLAVTTPLAGSGSPGLLRVLLNDTSYIEQDLSTQLNTLAAYLANSFNVLNAFNGGSGIERAEDGLQFGTAFTFSTPTNPVSIVNGESGAYDAVVIEGV